MPVISETCFCTQIEWSKRKEGIVRGGHEEGKRVKRRIDGAETVTAVAREVVGT